MMKYTVTQGIKFAGWTQQQNGNNRGKNQETLRKIKQKLSNLNNRKILKEKGISLRDQVGKNERFNIHYSIKIPEGEMKQCGDMV